MVDYLFNQHMYATLKVIDVFVFVVWFAISVKRMRADYADLPKRSRRTFWALWGASWVVVAAFCVSDVVRDALGWPFSLGGFLVRLLVSLALIAALWIARRRLVARARGKR